MWTGDGADSFWNSVYSVTVINTIDSHAYNNHIFNPHEMLLTYPRYWSSIQASTSFYKQQYVASKLIYLVFFGCLATTELAC